MGDFYVNAKYAVTRPVPNMTAAEAFADPYGTLSPKAGETWLADGRLDDSEDERGEDKTQRGEK
jgi:hypothetical protein